MVQFQGINQFRWVGWFNFALDIVALLLLVGFFRGECQISRRIAKPKRRARVKTPRTSKWNCSLSKAHIIKGTVSSESGLWLYNNYSSYCMGMSCMMYMLAETNNFMASLRYNSNVLTCLAIILLSTGPVLSNILDVPCKRC